ncbi:hypothetical protein ACFE04_017268 [Oxalis oulophora]
MTQEDKKLKLNSNLYKAAVPILELKELDAADSNTGISGFRLHIGGRLSFDDPWSYIGGSMIADWDIVPNELTMITLHHTIEIMGYEDRSNISTPEHVHNGRNTYNVTESAGNYDAEDDIDNESDEDWLNDVEYASDHENDELNELLAKSRGYVDEAATFGNTKRNAAGDIVDDDSEGDYSVGNDYEDDPDLNWSLVDGDEDELRKELAELGNEDVEKDLYHDLYTTYIPNPMRIGKDLWPHSDLNPLAAPPPRILKGRPQNKRRPEVGFTTVAAVSPSVRRKNIGKGPYASKKGKSVRSSPIRTKKAIVVHSQSTITSKSGVSTSTSVRMLKSLQVEMTAEEYVEQSSADIAGVNFSYGHPSKRMKVK